jgi:hypothetical protein
VGRSAGDRTRCGERLLSHLLTAPALDCSWGRAFRLVPCGSLAPRTLYLSLWGPAERFYFGPDRLLMKPLSLRAASFQRVPALPLSLGYIDVVILSFRPLVKSVHGSRPRVVPARVMRLRCSGLRCSGLSDLERCSFLLRSRYSQEDSDTRGRRHL